MFASCRVSFDVRETSRWAWSMDPTIRCHGIRNKTWISSLLVRIVMDRVLCEAKVNCVRVLEELLVDVRLGGVLVEDNAMCSCRRQVGAVWIFALVNEASLVTR